MPNLILYSHWSNSVQKNRSKTTKYSRNETMLKICHLAKAIYSIWAKNSNFSKTCQNLLGIAIGVILCKNSLGKKVKYSRNKTMLKIGHLAKAIAFAWDPFEKFFQIVTLDIPY